MPKSTLQTSSGYLPAEIYELSLEPSDAEDWRLWVGYRGDREDRAFEFGGGLDPQAWLADKLTSEHGFNSGLAVQAAAELFSAFLHSETDRLP